MKKELKMSLNELRSWTTLILLPRKNSECPLWTSTWIEQHLSSFHFSKISILGGVLKHLTPHCRYLLFAKNVVIALCIFASLKKKCRQVFVFVKEIINKHESTISVSYATRLSLIASPHSRRLETSTRTPVSSWHRPQGDRQNDAVSFCFCFEKIVQSKKKLFLYWSTFLFSPFCHSFLSDPFFVCERILVGS